MPDAKLTPCRFCRHPFDLELLGRYGCPNCESTKCLPVAYTPRTIGSTERSSIMSEKRKTAKAKRIKHRLVRIPEPMAVQVDRFVDHKNGDTFVDHVRAAVKNYIETREKSR